MTMKKIAAREAKNGFGQLLDTAQREPVCIEKKGRPVAVIISLEDYQRLEKMEEAWWANRADKAGQEGFLSASESEALLQEFLNADD